MRDRIDRRSLRRSQSFVPAIGLWASENIALAGPVKSQGCQILSEKDPLHQTGHPDTPDDTPCLRGVHISSWMPQRYGSSICENQQKQLECDPQKCAAIDTLL